MAVSRHIEAENRDAIEAARIEERRPRGPGAAFGRERLDPELQALAEETAPGMDEEVRNLMRRASDRVPFGDQEQSLAWPEIPGFRLYWFNDVRDRVARALRAGYVHVQHEDGTNVSFVVGSKKEGGSLIAYLMKTPIEFYREDLALSQERERRRIKQIKSGKIDGTDGDFQTHSYVDPARTNIGTRY